MDEVLIQYQGFVGNWFTVQIVLNNDLSIKIGLDSVSFQYPNARVRAMTQDGRVVDIR